MSQTSLTIQKNSVVPVLIVIIISAFIGAVIVLSIAFIGSMTAVMLSGPLGWLILGPTIIASFAAALTWMLIGIPLWAVIGGYLCAKTESGGLGIGAREMGVTHFSEDHPIYKKVQELAQPLNLPPVPYVGWFADDDINAFAMGLTQTNALVAFSQGAIEKLTKEEFDAVVAHELAHVANGDMRNMTFARGAQEALTFFLVFKKLKKFARWVFSPIAELKILHYSRQREFAADTIGAQLVSPEAMIGALSAIAHDTAPKPRPNDYDSLKFSSALSGGLWRTHPPLSKRIKALQPLCAAHPLEHAPAASSPPVNPSTPEAIPLHDTHQVTVVEPGECHETTTSTLTAGQSLGVLGFGI